MKAEKDWHRLPIDVVEYENIPGQVSWVSDQPESSWKMSLLIAGQLD